MEYPPLSGGPYGYARDDLAVVLRRFSGNGSPRPSARELFQLTETTKAEASAPVSGSSLRQTPRDPCEYSQGPLPAAQSGAKGTT